MHLTGVGVARVAGRPVVKTDPRVTSFCIQKRINGAETIKRAPPKYFLHRETTALVSAVLLAVATVREAGLAGLLMLILLPGMTLGAIVMDRRSRNSG